MGSNPLSGTDVPGVSTEDFLFSEFVIKTDEEKNPWEVGSLQDFLEYHCPECDFHAKEENFFYQHAIETHSKAKLVFFASQKVFVEDRAKSIQDIEEFDQKVDVLVQGLEEIDQDHVSNQGMKVTEETGSEKLIDQDVFYHDQKILKNLLLKIMKI